VAAALSRLGTRSTDPLVRDGYERFVWPEASADQPEQVWVIGGGVTDALVGLRGIEPGRSISQPQAARTTEHRQRFADDLATMCMTIASITP